MAETYLRIRRKVIMIGGKVSLGDTKVFSSSGKDSLSCRKIFDLLKGLLEWL